MIRSDRPDWCRALQARDLALGWLTIGTPEPNCVIEAAAAGGFGAVGLKFMGRPGEVKPALLTDRNLQRDVARSLDDNGLKLLNLGSLWLDGKREVDEFRPAVEAGASMGAAYAIGISTDSDEARQVQQFGELAALCAQFDVEVALEFFAYSAVKSLGAALRILEHVSASNLKLLIDSLHFARSGGTPAKLGSLGAARLGYFQLCDAPAQQPAHERLSHEGGKDRMDPGEGALPLAEYLSALTMRVPIEIEIPRIASRDLSPAERGREVAQRSLSFLRE